MAETDVPALGAVRVTSRHRRDGVVPVRRVDGAELTEAIEGFRAMLRSWTPGAELAEHLQAACTFVPKLSQPDADAVLAVVRMTRDDPALRAVLLVLQERAEPTFAEVLGPRVGLPADALEVRVWAATVNAALRVVTDDFAHAAADGVTPQDVDRHRQRLAEMLRTATRVRG